MSTGTCSHSWASGMRGFIAKNTSKSGALCGMTAEGKFDTQALLCTTLEVPPRQVREWFGLRGQVEGTFAAARAHLGLETQRQWSAQAVARTTPCVLGLYSLVILLAERLRMQHALTVRRDAWYAKENVTFSDTLAMVRRWLWGEQYFQLSQT